MKAKILKIGEHTFEVYDPTAQRAEPGKGLSKNDYTDEDKEKLANIERHAQRNVIDKVRVNGDVVPIISKAVNLTVPQNLSDLEDDSTHRTVTDAEKQKLADLPNKSALDMALAGKYEKPGTGIPKTDLAEGVQASLGKADTALQEHQDISGKANKSEMSVSESGDKTTITLKSGLSAEVINQHQSLTHITDLIPGQASPENQLADKEFVNSSIETNTASFNGTYNLVSDLSLTVAATASQIATALGTSISGADNNDYAFVQIPTADATPLEIARVDRFKYDGAAWAYEWSLNNSSFTAAQWAALNSGITSGLVGKLSDLPTAIQLETSFGGKVDKVNGKGLSTEDYTTDEKTKLGTIAANAQVNAIEGVQVNGTDLTPDGNKKVNVLVPTTLAGLSEDTTHRVVTDAEKTAWNGKESSANKVSGWQSTPDDTHYPSEKLVKDSLDGKQATLVSGTNIKTINSQSILGSGDITIQGGGGTKDYAENDPENAAYIMNRPGGYDYTLYDADIEYDGVTLVRQYADYNYVVESIIPETGDGATLHAIAERGYTIPCTYVPSDGTMQGQTVNGTILYDVEGEGLELTTATGDDSTEASDITIDPADIPGGILVEDVYHYPIKFPSKYIPSDNAKEDKANKVSDISENRESTEKYPNAKAVYDAYFKRGVVSQKQTWRQAADGGYDYVMSDLVYGDIPRTNIDLYEAVGAVFNATSGYFELNGLTDISYEEMQKIYEGTIGIVGLSLDRSLQLSGLEVRTNIPFATIWDYDINLSYLAYLNSTIEVIAFANRARTVRSSMCNGCRRLKKIISRLALSASLSSAFSECYSLEDVQLLNLNSNISFKNSARLSLASVQYMVEKAANTSAITITLHATAYARCQADTTEYTYGGQTYTGILAYASARNITIASA